MGEQCQLRTTVVSSLLPPTMRIDKHKERAKQNILCTYPMLAVCMKFFSLVVRIPWKHKWPEVFACPFVNKIYNKIANLEQRFSSIIETSIISFSPNSPGICQNQKVCEV